MYIDQMGIGHEDSTPDYGTLYLISQNLRNVNEYGGSDTTDVSKLALLTNAAPGSTCLFNNGDIYIKNLDGTWSKFGEEETASVSNTANPTSLNLSPLNVNRDELTSEIGLNEIGDEFEKTPKDLTVEPVIIDKDLM